MLHEYLITAFKVVVGVITNNRLVLAGLIALGILFLWVFFSLICSFQRKFCSNVRRINNYVSRNGISGDAKQGLNSLISKMPSEFQKGYKKYERNLNSLPSENIKRFESLEMEISGGVFNQNKSVIKTYINSVFVALLVFSLAILSPEEALTGYSLAEATVIPLIFFITAKITYYVYTAIRQYQYKTAIDEFNYMLENLDKAAMDTVSNQDSNEMKKYEVKVVEQAPAVLNVEKVEEVEQKPLEDQVQQVEEKVEKHNVSAVSKEEIEALKRQMLDVFPEQEQIEIQKIEKQSPQEVAKPEEVRVDTTQEQQVASETNNSVETGYGANIPFEFDFYGDLDESLEDIEPDEELDVEDKENNDEVSNESVDDLNSEKQDVSNDNVDNKSENDVQVETGYGSNVADKFDFYGDVDESSEDIEPDEDVEMNEEDKQPIINEEKEKTKLDFSSLMEGESVDTVVKRGRGRPKKEVSESGELVIKNDKEFEEALVRAEKLMRKNEEPLSASQTKRIEKQIKELVDAMTKYKEGK